MKESIRNLLIVLLLDVFATFCLPGGSCDAAQNKIAHTNDAPSTGAAKSPAGGAVAKGIEFAFLDAGTRMGLKEITVSVNGPQVNKTALYKSFSGWFPASFANGQYSVVASGAGYQTYSFTFDTTTLKQYSRLEVYLDPKLPDGKGILIVYVGDEATKKPLIGVSVSITGPGGSQTGVVSGGSQNTAVFHNLLSGAYGISVAPSSGYQAVNGSANVKSPTEALVYLWTKPTGGYAVNVKVNGPDGKTISGASVTASGAFGSVAGTTGGDGTAKLMVPAGKTTITVRAAGYSNMQIPNISVPFSNPPVLVIPLMRLDFLNVMVFDENNKAIAGAQVIAKNLSSGGASPAPTVTDGKGNVSLQVVPGSYSILVSCKGYKDNMVGNYSSHQTVRAVLGR